MHRERRTPKLALRPQQYRVVAWAGIAESKTEPWLVGKVPLNVEAREAVITSW